MDNLNNSIGVSIVLVLELLLPFLITLFAFIFGFIKLKKTKGLYFKIYVFSSGCLSIGFLSLGVMILCSFERALIISELISLFGTGFFLLSANYGTIDKIVEENKIENTKKNKIALIAPIILCALAGILIFGLSTVDFKFKIASIISLVPIFSASYYNLKHLLIKKDDFNILKSTKICNIISLCLYVSMIGFIFFGLMMEFFIAYYVLAINMLILVVAAIKGAKTWLI